MLTFSIEKPPAYKASGLGCEIKMKSTNYLLEAGWLAIIYFSL